MPHLSANSGIGWAHTRRRHLIGTLLCANAAIRPNAHEHSLLQFPATIFFRNDTGAFFCNPVTINYKKPPKKVTLRVIDGIEPKLIQVNHNSKQVVYLYLYNIYPQLLRFQMRQIESPVNMLKYHVISLQHRHL